MKCKNRDAKIIPCSHGVYSLETKKGSTVLPSYWKLELLILDPVVSDSCIIPHQSRHDTNKEKTHVSLKVQCLV